jgi:hypothetical protein
MHNVPLCILKAQPHLRPNPDPHPLLTALTLPDSLLHVLLWSTAVQPTYDRLLLHSRCIVKRAPPGLEGLALPVEMVPKVMMWISGGVDGGVVGGVH